MASTTRSPVYQHNFFNSLDNDFYQSNNFMPEPPAPPAGDSLLDDHESNALADFFDKVSSGRDVDSSFLLDGVMPNFFDPKLPDPTLWGWHDETAATEMYPFQPSSDLSAHQYLTQPGATKTSTTTTTMTTTTTLPNTNGNSVSSTKRQSVVPQDLTISTFNPFDPDGARAQASQTPRTENKPPTLPQRDSMLSQHSGIGGGLAWGSDPHFNQTGYQNPEPGPDFDVNHRVSSLILKTKPSLEDTTAAPSPAEFKPEPNDDDTEDESRESESSSSAQQQHQQQQQQQNQQKKKTKQSRGRSHSSGCGGDMSPRIKKSVKGSGSKRDNLSEAQKRENHIQSEQKRRNLIRTGFEDLQILVPELRGGGYSKSAVLVHAASFLEQIEDGNKRLRMQIAQLEGRF